jgi:multisubunit Na+/H+ antiporter MnhE subunit
MTAALMRAAGRDGRRFFDRNGEEGYGVYVLFFLLWLLMTGEVTVHACLWGMAVSAAMTWFCWKFLDYRLSLPRLGQLWVWVRYLIRLLAEMLGKPASW